MEVTKRPVGQTQADTDAIKALRDKYQAFNEQERLNARITSELYPVDTIPHPVKSLFFGCRDVATPERMGGMEAFLRLQHIAADLDGLTYNEAAQLFNFIESTSFAEVKDVCAIHREHYLDCMAMNYNACGRPWLAKVEEWKAEVLAEKLVIVDELNALITEVNKKTASVKGTMPRKNGKK